MTDEPASPAPANAGQLFPNFVFFDSAPVYGLSPGGIGQITLEANTLIAGPDGRVQIDRVVVCHLRSSLPAILSLRNAIDAILTMAAPKAEGPAN
jgi:hypothetical protein